MAVTGSLLGPFYVGEDITYTDTISTVVTSIQNWTLSATITRTMLTTDTVLATGTVTITDPIAHVVQIVVLASSWTPAMTAGAYVLRLRREDVGNNVVLSVYRFVLQPAPA